MSDIFYGEQTKKAVINFGKGQLPFELIAAYGEVKKAVMMAIQESENSFDNNIYEAIISSIDEIIDGQHNNQFPLSLFQGGAGTSINMNFNEVIANLASEKIGSDMVKPLEHINKYQSTNDTFPTAVTIVALRLLNRIESQVINLQEKLITCEKDYDNILMTGRTEMQDGLPITLGQVFASWAGSIERDRWRLHKLKERVRTIPLGGTALGTSFSAPGRYIFSAEKHLRNITRLPVCRSQNLTDEVANQDKFSELLYGFSLCAQNLFKIATDLQLYTSSFIGELKHPDLQYGSTIMAAKSNPVILELVRGLSIEVQSEAHKVSLFSQNGQLQLNSFLPFILNSIINGAKALEKSISALDEKFIHNMSINHEAIEENLINSNCLLNNLLPLIGYEKIKDLYLKLKNKKFENMEDYKKTISHESGISKEEIDFYFDPTNATSLFKEFKK